MEWINQHAFELVEQVTETTVKQLRLTLEEGWKAGEGIEDLARRIRQVFDQATRYRSFVIARTETTAAANMAQIAVMERAGHRYKMWWAAQDERMCPLCGALHGKTVRIDEEFAPGVFAPPRHPNCRCTTLAAPELRVGEFESLDDALEWARTAYPHITWEFEGANVDTVNPTLKEFHKLARAHPEAVKTLKFVSTKHPQMPEDAFAIYDPSEERKGIYFNPKYYRDKALLLERLKASVESGYHPKGCDNIEYVLAHEFGHHLDFWITSAGENAAVLPVVSTQDGVGLVASTLREFKQQWYARGDHVAELSRYARVNNTEMFAEAFSSLHSGQGAGEIVRHLKVLLEELAPENWTNNWRWMHEVEDQKELSAARKAIARLRRRLGLK
ncbi:MAG: phage minor head protein [Bacillota bacterium]